MRESATSHLTDGDASASYSQAANGSVLLKTSGAAQQNEASNP